MNPKRLMNMEILALRYETPEATDTERELAQAVHELVAALQGRQGEVVRHRAEAKLLKEGAFKELVQKLGVATEAKGELTGELIRRLTDENLRLRSQAAADAAPAEPAEASDVNPVEAAEGGGPTSGAVEWTKTLLADREKLRAELETAKKNELDALDALKASKLIGGDSTSPKSVGDEGELTQALAKMKELEAANKELAAELLEALSKLADAEAQVGEASGAR